MKKADSPKNSIKLIYNPHAGKKRNALQVGNGVSLEDIKGMLRQYQIPVDYAPTKAPGHATELAKNAKKEGYSTVLVAGGDGTTGEAANGLVGSSTKLGVIPMGTYMNIARMLSIPTEIEKAIALIKIGRVRKIDVGSITKIEGEKLADPYYFLESVGIGLDAHVQKEFKEFEKGNIASLFKILGILKNFYANKITLTTSEETLETRATFMSIANGPFAGAGLQLSPDAKLNDHKLTISLYKMGKLDFLRYLFTMKFKGKVDRRRIKTIQTTNVKIHSHRGQPVHADARLFGTTPVELKIVPNALEVICGFPSSNEESSLDSRTILDP